MKKIIKFSLATILLALPAASLAACTKNATSGLIVDNLTTEQLNNALKVKVKSLQEMIAGLTVNIEKLNGYYDAAKLEIKAKAELQSQIKAEYEAIKTITDKLKETTDIKILDIVTMTAGDLGLEPEEFNKLDQFHKMLKAIETYRGKMQTRVTQLESKVTALEKKIAEGEREVAIANEKLNEIIKKFQELLGEE